MVIWSVLRFSNYMLSKSSLSCNNFMIIWPLMVLAHNSWHFLYSLQAVKWLISMKYHCWPSDVVWSLSAPFSLSLELSFLSLWPWILNDRHIFKATAKLTAGCQLWAEQALVWREISAGYAKAWPWVLDDHSTPGIPFPREDTSPTWSLALRRQ